MSVFNWEGFLRQWSGELLEAMDECQHRHLPPEILESGWLGYPQATDAQISQAEARLGRALPPSYREFLKVTNGWRQTTPFIHRLWSTEEIDWFSARHAGWIESFGEKYNDQAHRVNVSNHAKSNGCFSQSGIFQISDESYFVYGDDQDCMNLRLEYLHTALEISEPGDSSIYLLNPQVINVHGEWEAWFFGDWLPGADRYRSFQEMMQAEYRNFLELRES
jgi:SMI1 / KNR4 family (SUKH-1)